MAMNFFEHQEAARRSSRLLIVLLALAVLAIVVAVNAALAAIYLTFFTGHAAHGPWARQGLAALPPYFFAANTGLVLLIIVGGAIMQILDLREGGEAVARMVGARAVDPATRDPLERRLLNVVEEMALASGIGAPRAYVLDGEEGINAFAAGMRTSDAIVAVTHGALARLTRDELQGVIGHEFSHILNGDMGLNLRLIGVLQGLLMFALFGRFLLSVDEGRSSRRLGAIALAGLVVLAIGYIGVFFGRLIKASISRQREFLADASSVQFTRNPDGIGGALRKIGGLGAEGGGAIRHVHAETLSHMFMAPASLALADGLLASHPPLGERLRRIYGRAVEFLAADELPAPQAPDPTAAPMEFERAPLPSEVLVSPLAPGASVAGAKVAGAAGAALHASIGRPSSGAAVLGGSLSAQIDALGLRPAVADALQAQYLIAAMLLDTDPGVRAQQLAAVAERYGSAAQPGVEKYAAIVATLPPGWRLALLDLSMPALRTLAVAQRASLMQIVHVLIQADGRVTLPEFLLYTVLKRRLAPARPANGPGRSLRLEDTGAEARIVMSLIASVRLPKEAQRAFDAGRALVPSAGPTVDPRAGDLPLMSAAFERLADLAPLQKPLLVKACFAIAFVDGTSHWRAVSCLRTLCAALDCPIPPQAETQETQTQ
jgi:Zn-dependent protease with chaperone function